MERKHRAPRNRTITLTQDDVDVLRSRLRKVKEPVLSLDALLDQTINQDLFEVVGLLPSAFADLIVVDPPYNLSKTFNTTSFKQRSYSDYVAWLDSWLPEMYRLMKPTGSIYICGDWASSSAISTVAEKHFIVRNRITWEREKGRGALANWKNCSEDIWFCTKSEEYYFNVDAVKLKRKVIAPYTNEAGDPKDWNETEHGRFRLTSPSNLWTDLTVPFWSMPENTDHPTQKPEKLIAKIVLASSRPNEIVFDPFLGSGTTSVVAKKLGRHFVGIEIDEVFACLAEKRLEMAGFDNSIQGYSEGVFYERNTFIDSKNSMKSNPSRPNEIALF
ncbi:site-specific DNA-methyltransferase [bacterium]|nr:site-specific DNA-methyltransferase [bacterium]